MDGERSSYVASSGITASVASPTDEDVEWTVKYLTTDQPRSAFFTASSAVSTKSYLHGSKLISTSWNFFNSAVSQLQPKSSTNTCA